MVLERKFLIESLFLIYYKKLVRESTKKNSDVIIQLSGCQHRLDRAVLLKIHIVLVPAFVRFLRYDFSLPDNRHSFVETTTVRSNLIIRPNEWKKQQSGIKFHRLSTNRLTKICMRRRKKYRVTVQSYEVNIQ